MGAGRGCRRPGWDLLGLGDEGVVVYPAEDLPQPFDARPRGVLAAEDVVLAGHVRALGVALVPDLGVGERAFEDAGRKIASAVPSELSIVPVSVTPTARAPQTWSWPPVATQAPSGRARCPKRPRDPPGRGASQPARRGAKRPGGMPTSSSNPSAKSRL